MPKDPPRAIKLSLFRCPNVEVSAHLILEGQPGPPSLTLGTCGLEEEEVLVAEISRRCGASEGEEDQLPLELPSCWRPCWIVQVSGMGTARRGSQKALEHGIRTYSAPFPCTYSDVALFDGHVPTLRLSQDSGPQLLNREPTMSRPPKGSVEKSLRQRNATDSSSQPNSPRPLNLESRPNTVTLRTQTRRLELPSTSKCRKICSRRPAL